MRRTESRDYSLRDDATPLDAPSAPLRRKSGTVRQTFDCRTAPAAVIGPDVPAREALAPFGIFGGRAPGISEPELRVLFAGQARLLAARVGQNLRVGSESLRNLARLCAALATAEGGE